MLPSLQKNPPLMVMVMWNQIKKVNLQTVPLKIMREKRALSMREELHSAPLCLHFWLRPAIFILQATKTPLIPQLETLHIPVIVDLLTIHLKRPEGLRTAHCSMLKHCAMLDYSALAV
jgi:hypothetical protein